MPALSFPSQKLAQTLDFGDAAVVQGIPYATNDWRNNASGLFGGLVGQILNIVLIIGTIAVLFYLVWGGFEWLTAGGDKGKTEKARDKITQAVIGLIIIVSAWAIMLFVQSLLGIEIFAGSGGSGGSQPAAFTCVPAPIECTENGGRLGGGTCPAGRYACTFP